MRYPGARGLLAPCRRRFVADAALGVPGGLAARVASRFHQAGHARGEQPPAWSSAHRRDEARSADHGSLRLQHQSGKPGAADQQDREGTVARGSVLRDGGAFRHRHGRLRRHRAARDHGRRARRHDVLLGPFLFDHQREGDRAARRGQVQCRDLPPACRRHGLRRSPVQDGRHGACRALREVGRAADGRHRHGIFPQARLFPSCRRHAGRPPAARRRQLPDAVGQGRVHGQGRQELRRAAVPHDVRGDAVGRGRRSAARLSAAARES